eukprot:jgi/Mesvir1/5168/Mv15306-RA.1
MAADKFLVRTLYRALLRVAGGLNDEFRRHGSVGVLTREEQAMLRSVLPGSLPPSSLPEPPANAAGASGSTSACPARLASSASSSSLSSSSPSSLPPSSQPSARLFWMVQSGDSREEAVHGRDGNRISMGDGASMTAHSSSAPSADMHTSAAGLGVDENRPPSSFCPSRPGWEGARESHPQTSHPQPLHPQTSHQPQRAGVVPVSRAATPLVVVGGSGRRRQLAAASAAAGIPTRAINRVLSLGSSGYPSEEPSGTHLNHHDDATRVEEGEGGRASDVEQAREEAKASRAEALEGERNEGNDDVVGRSEDKGSNAVVDIDLVTPLRAAFRATEGVVEDRIDSALRALPLFARRLSMLRRMATRPQGAALTNGVLVTVESKMVRRYTLRVDSDLYFFRCKVRIENVGLEEPVVLVNRYTELTDCEGHVRTEAHWGVAGQQPCLASGQSFEYCSEQQLRVPHGMMLGHFMMFQTRSGKVFDARIPPFALQPTAEVTGDCFLL